MKYIISILLITVLTSCNSDKSKNPTSANKMVVEVETLAVSNRERNYTIPAILKAKKRANIAFQLSGTIDQVLVKVGDKVEKDQALMSLYNPNLDPNLVSNLAQLESVNAQISQAKRDVKRLKDLQKMNSASKNALETKETNLKNLFAQKKSIQAQIQKAKANQSESIITAPFASHVVSVDKEFGEFVAAGQAVVILNKNDELEVNVKVSEDILKELDIGDIIIGYKNLEKLRFQIAEIAQSADPQSHLYSVTLEAKNDGSLNPGSSVDLIFKRVFENVYKLPLEAIVDDGINRPYIFEIENTMAKKKKINPLFIENDLVIFTTMNDISNPIVVKGQARLVEGLSVEIPKLNQ